MPPSRSAAVSSSGTLLVGLVFAVWLSSSTVHWTSSYVRRTGDMWQWQVLVVFFTALSTAHTAIWCYEVYGRVIEGFGDEVGLSETSWVLTAHLAILLTLATLAQAYFTAKLSTLYSGRRRAFLVSSVALLTAAQLAFGIAAAFYSLHEPPKSLFTVDLGTRYGWALLASSLAALLANTLISVALVVDMRSGRFAARDETAVEVFVRLGFESNAATAVVSIVACAFCLAWTAQGEGSGVFLALSIVLPKLYLLSVLASLERGVDLVPAALSRTIKHASSLSDMFKGVPLGPMRASGPPSRAGAQGTPIADLYAAGAVGGGETEGWLRRTFQPAPASPATVNVNGSTPAPPLHSLAPPPAGFEFAPHTHTHTHTAHDALAAPRPPPSQRPVTGISVSDYGAWLDDDDDDERGGGQQPVEASSARLGGVSAAAYAGHTAAAAAAARQGDVWASGVEHAAQAGTPTPRKSTFGFGGEDDDEGLVRGAPAAAARGGGPGAVAPVRYGYL
ncbi:hypothetical protein JCM8208_004435 [Rhodotorula glutinis]